VSDKPFFFTLPLDPRWRNIIEKDQRSLLSKVVHPRALLVYKHILDHGYTKEVLIRLARVSRKGVSLDFFNDILWHSYKRISPSLTDGSKRVPWMSNHKELKRMADNARELRKRLSRYLEEIERSNPQIFGNPDFQRHRVISIFVDGFAHRDVKLSDIEILESLDAVGDFWDAYSRPRAPHRPENLGMKFFLSRLEFRFREEFSKPLIPVIALLAQVVSDTKQTLNRKTPNDKWTPARVTTILKRIPKEIRSPNSRLKK